MQKVVRFIICILVVAGISSFSNKKKDKVNWLSLEELQVEYAKNPKPVLIDVYTDWCGWCKVMDRETYNKDAVIEYINQHYYAVKLNAEAKDSLTMDGKKYGFKEEYRANELAVYLLYGQMSYPTTVFLPALNAQPAPLPGFLKPKELEAPLKFFGDGIYKDKTFQEFQKDFTGKW